MQKPLTSTQLEKDSQVIASKNWKVQQISRMRILQEQETLLFRISLAVTTSLMISTYWALAYAWTDHRASEQITGTDFFQQFLQAGSLAKKIFSNNPTASVS